MAIDFPATPTTGQQYTYAGVTYTFSAQGVWSPAFSQQAQTSSGPQGRLTLQSQTPVMIAQALGATGLIYTPYVGNKIPLFDGSDLVMYPFSETTGTTVDNTHNPSVIGANQVNDWFFWKDGNTGRLSHGPDWTNATTRSAGTALVRINGIFLNAVQIGDGAVTGPKAQRGTYVGTTRSNASSLLDWKLGSGALGGGAATLNVWNAYNRKDTWTEVADTTSSWTLGAAGPRPLNNSVNNRISFVMGLAEDAMQASLWQSLYASAVTGAIFGFGVDSVSAFAGPTAWFSVTGGGTAGVVNIYPAMLGYHFVQALEWGNGGTSTMYGDETVIAAPLFLLSQGLQFTMMM